MHSSRVRYAVYIDGEIEHLIRVGRAHTLYVGWRSAVLSSCDIFLSKIGKLLLVSFQVHCTLAV